MVHIPLDNVCWTYKNARQSFGRMSCHSASFGHTPVIVNLFLQIKVVLLSFVEVHVALVWMGETWPLWGHWMQCPVGSGKENHLGKFFWFANSFPNIKCFLLLFFWSGNTIPFLMRILPSECEYNVSWNGDAHPDVWNRDAHQTCIFKTGMCICMVCVCIAKNTALRINRLYCIPDTWTYHKFLKVCCGKCDRKCAPLGESTLHSRSRVSQLGEWKIQTVPLYGMSYSV